MFAAEGNQLLVITGFTLYSQKAMLETPALQVILELPDDITGQGPALLRKHVLKQRPVLLDQLIEKSVLWLVSLVLKWANGPEIVLEDFGWQGRESLCSCDNQPYPSLSIAVSAFTIYVREAIPRSHVGKWPKAMREFCGTRLCMVMHSSA